MAPELSPDELLSRAVKACDADSAARVLAAHPELESRLSQPLLGAVMRTDRKTIDVLLEAGADINGIGVLDECHPELAPFLMERGAAPDAHCAARLGMFDKLRELAVDDTVLHFASTVEIAEYLLDRGVDIDALDPHHQSTPAQHMVRVVQARHYPRDRQDIARFLVARGCKTDILMAAALGDLDLVRRHLDSIRTRVTTGYYVEAFGPNRTAHLVARDFGHKEVFQFLMERSPTDLSYERLPDAAQSNDTEAVRLMLSAGSPVDSKGEYDLTALQWGSWHGNAEMVREILRYHPKELELRSAQNGSENSWHRDTGDYGAVMEAIREAQTATPDP